MKHILFITSTNLASNPRCRKEIEVAQELNYSSTVYAFDMANWTRQKEQEIRGSLKGVRYHSLQASRRPLLPWLINSLIGKGARILYKVGWRSPFISAITTDKRTLALVRALKKEASSFDLIIAHNPGAFYPAWNLSRKSGIPFAVDVEDYHPGENNEPIVRHAVTGLMKTILPDALYTSAASPMILNAVVKLMNGSRMGSAFTINNVFPAKEFVFHKQLPEEGKLKFVWFSQHISFSRGLDDVLPLLATFSNRIKLILIGNLDLAFYERVLKHFDFIEVRPPMSQELLNNALSEFDVGLALEVNGVDENRKICLTNKIWSYLQAGLYILASDTPAQVQFSQQYPGQTRIVDINDRESCLSCIQETLKSIDSIRTSKASWIKDNQAIAWENEYEKLVQEWKNLKNV